MRRASIFEKKMKYFPSSDMEVALDFFLFCLSCLVKISIFPQKTMLQLFSFLRVVDFIFLSIFLQIFIKFNLTRSIRFKMVVGNEHLAPWSFCC